MDETIVKLYPDYITQNFPSTPTICVIPIRASEQQKELSAVAGIWHTMLQNQIDRNALFINIGGGTISDLGGFIASNYLRGIKMINIPTTLLAMIDAAVGGKNGINFNGIKNAIGNIYHPSMLYLDKTFLQSLPRHEILNGYGELIKYALIGNEKLWEELLIIKEVNSHTILPEWIDTVVSYKQEIVRKDPDDRMERRILNFGHTIGHALESYFFEKDHPLSHGHAIAIGCCCESYISYRKNFILPEDVERITGYIKRYFTIPNIPGTDYLKIYEWCKYDKKNASGKFNITLLEQIGKATPNHECTETDILDSLHFVFDRK